MDLEVYYTEWQDGLFVGKVYHGKLIFSIQRQDGDTEWLIKHDRSGLHTASVNLLEGIERLVKEHQDGITQLSLFGDQP